MTWFLISVLPLCLCDSVVGQGSLFTTESQRHRGSTEKNPKLISNGLSQNVYEEEKAEKAQRKTEVQRPTSCNSTLPPRSSSSCNSDAAAVDTSRNQCMLTE